FAHEPTTPPESPVTPDNLAYVIYTSGSTGKPKGTMLHHRGLCNFVRAWHQDVRVEPDDRVLQFAAFSFDASVAEVFTTLLAGAELLLARREALLSTPDLARLLQEQEVTAVTLPPVVLKMLPTEGLEALRTVMSAGEACSPEIVARWAPGRRFFNGYGPTEVTVAATWALLEAPLPEGTTNVPIGRPFANVRVYVLDAHRRPVPIGVPGELCVGGTGVGRGYLHRPDLTAERFIPDPFSNVPGARLYRTGDLVRFRPDGSLEFLGRIDHQVKVRGFRIELGEIEVALRRHPRIQEAVVLAREDRPGEKRLVAYVVPPPHDGAAPTVSELRTFLQETLPDYMVPAAFVVLDAMPLTPSGKVDRRALPAPDQARPDLEGAYVAPRTREEEILAQIWAEVLGVERVGVHDNFFELGGDSILSIQVIARANQAGLRLTPRHLFQAPTVAGLAALAGTGRAVEAEQGIVEGPVPLTPIQHWFFERNLPNPHHWNQAVLLEVHRPLAPALLEQTIGHLLAHHDALRLRFRRRGEEGTRRRGDEAMRRRGDEAMRERGDEAGAWEQVNAGLEDTVPLTWLDLSALPEPARRPAIEATAAQAQASLNLTYGPLLRALYFDLGPDVPDRLLLVIHHLAVDGVSW
ncbi:MAG: amino acid adenylation domain-containing protein, partial [Chloroflexi bacterium]